MIDWIKDIFKRNKKKVGAGVEPSKPWPRHTEAQLALINRETQLSQPLKPYLPPKREGAYFNHPRLYPDSNNNFILGVVVGAATDNAILGGSASGSITGGLVGDVMNDGCLGDCDCGSSWDSGSSYDSGGGCDSGGSCGD